MRTTITLDDEVAALVKKAMKQRKISFRELINSALKASLLREEVREAPSAYHTQPHEGGRLLSGDLSNIGEALSRLDETDQ